MTAQAVDVAIVGAGFSGLAMAIALHAAGRDDMVVLEKGEGVGGTWRDNTYPGCACDVPSHLYSYSFAQNPDWTRRYAPQPEILAYLERCADTHGVRPFLRFGHEVTEARWDAARGRWRVSVRDRPPVLARALVLGTGALHRPAFPSVPGRATFEGPSFHSAAWDHDVDLRGRTVGVIGTGASAIQFIPPLVEQAERVVVFQRTAPWVLPRPDGPVPLWERAMYRAVPGLQRLYRWLLYAGMESQVAGFAGDPRLMAIARRLGERHLRDQVPDPARLALLTPSYTPGCKRILLSNDYYPAMARPHVSVETGALDAVAPDGVVLRDGRRIALDAIVYGTGFRVTEPVPPGVILGRDGVDLHARWSERMTAHKGTTVAGFPNLFVLMGPNTGLGHNSMVFMIETQVAYAMQALDTMDRRGAQALEVRPAAQQAWNEALQPRFEGTVWASGCQSWYLDGAGHNPTIWPGSTLEFWARLRRFDPDGYAFTPTGS